LLFSTIGIAASDFFSVNLSTIASILGLSESIAGVTFLAFGNGSPDVFSTFAAMSTHSGSLAVGELIGAAGFITAVVAGSMALVREFKVGKKTFVRDNVAFIFAAAFSMYFLADGALYFWECCVMIGYYISYVIMVVVWHWLLSRRRKQRERNALARDHYAVPGNVEIEVQEEDADDEDPPTGERRSLLQRGQAEDFDALERGGGPALNLEGASDDSDEDGERGRLLAAEMSTSMRVTRRAGSRRNTLIRPSLVGALEFRSVLSTLQKTRNTNLRPIHLRRYSDDPTASSDRNDPPASETAVTSDYDGSVVITGPEESSELSSSTRARAVSMNDAGGVKHLNPAAFSVAHIPDIGVVAATPTFPKHLRVPSVDSAPVSPSGSVPSSSHSGPMPPSPTISISPPPSADSARGGGSVTSPRGKENERYTTQEDGFPGARHMRHDFFLPRRKNSTHSFTASPRTRSPGRPQLHIPRSRDSSRGQDLPMLSPFPNYTDSPGALSAHSSRAPSLLLPEATRLSHESSHILESIEDELKPIRWWPYRFLPCPRLLLATLFPTLCSWSDKSIWDKMLSLLSTPSIFLLTVTLPVVEPESKDDEPTEEEIHEEPLPMLRRRSTRQRLTPSSPYLEAGVEPEWLHYRRATMDHGRARGSSTSQRPHGFNGHHNAADLAVSVESLHHHSVSSAQKDDTAPADVDEVDLRKDWNRWLVAVQIFTAPLFVMLIIWANSDQLTVRHLAKLVLYSLLGSTVVFGILMLTTAAEKPPKYRFLFCFLGFVVSVAWISTIANEVVGVLKAFGVILGISDAILGLTIFAVGNSLGDLVADITVARLGYPVMALSACFGGPMLNILLGIGISGLYMTIKEGHHKHTKHPDQPMKYKPYKVEVSGTLMISGITLLVTLVGLLVVVPLNNWVMSRKIGWGLITLWSISTIVNLVVEITGVWPDA
jgi:sodium/potassium/calcium exchanger 6